MRQRRRFLPSQEEKYLELLLADTNPENKKFALQTICGIYRNGFRFKNEHSLRQSLNGALYSADTKVVRWAENAIAVAGLSEDNLQAIVDCIRRNRHDPEIVISGVGALFAIGETSRVGELLRREDIPLEGALLAAAAQHDDETRSLLLSKRVDIDTSSPMELRFSALLVGLERAPENLFSSRHPNAEIIGHLNRHDDPLVAQYSVWSIVENRSLGLRDLQIPLQDIQGQPGNVRGWIYRLIASDARNALKHYECLNIGSVDSEAEARRGLALGLRSTYFEGLEELVLDWWPNESDENIRHRLEEHMAAFSENCGSYEDLVLDIFSNAGAHSLLRTRLEGAARGKNLYRKLRSIALRTEQASLFSKSNWEGPSVMVKQTFTGPTTIGNLAGQGSISTESVKVIGNMKGRDDLKDLLTEVLRFIGDNVSPAKREEGQALVVEAAKEPNAGRLSAIVNWLGSLAKGSSFLSGTVESVDKIIHHLNQAIDHLPS